VFAADGRLLGATRALLGSALGDDSAPGVGDLEPAKIPLHQRTTPAGRFVSEPGFNLDGEHVVWVDYDAGIAIHRLRPGASRPSRERRLATATAADKRVSLGCIVVPPSFYDAIVRPALGGRLAVVYVLPETRPVADWLDAMQAAF
jgi:hypothetical protein